MDEAEPTPPSPAITANVPEPSLGKARRGKPWLRPGAWSVGVVGLLVLGGAGAQLVFPRTVIESSAANAQTAPRPTETAVGSAAMPDVLGLDEDTARRVLVDAGILATVEINGAPAAGPEGVVVNQTPAPGSEATGRVTFTLSTSVIVPSTVIGASIDDARTVLEVLGAVVQVTRTVDPTQPEGVVISSDPQVGEHLGAVIALVVSDAGEAVPLTTLDRVSGSQCSSLGQGTVNGVAVQSSVTCAKPSYGDTTSASAEWILARQGAAIEATLGVLDRGDPGAATVRFYLDGTPVSETNVTYGTSTPIRVDVRDALRLKLEVVVTDGDPTVVIGDGRILGSADQIAALVAAQ